MRLARDVDDRPPPGPTPGPVAGHVLVSAAGACAAERRRLAELLYEGYAGKADALRVDRDTALALLGDGLNLDRCFVAVAGGQVVGIVGLGDAQVRPLDFPFRLLRRRFGTWRAAAYSVLLGVRNLNRPGPNEVLLENLAVSPPWRNRGIGARLVAHVEASARARGCSHVALDVTDTNNTALQFYLHLGYEIVKARRYPLIRKRVGFGGNYRMRKDVSEGACEVGFLP